jgi:hypothetical protein
MQGRPAAEEPSWAALGRHSGRLFRRARRHVRLVCGLAALATLGALGVAYRRPVRQRATVSLRLTEDAESSALPWTDRALRGYVNEVALSQTQLARLIDRHHMFRQPGVKFDPIAAVATLRERIEVEVSQNHTISLIQRDNRPRSAYVHIKYDDGDPERVMVIARELGELMVEAGRSEQRRQAETAVRLATAEARAARAALQDLRAEATRAIELAPRQARSTEDIPGLRDAVRLAQARLDRAEESVVNAGRRLRNQTFEGGLDIQVLETVASPPPWGTGKRLGAVAVGASVICLPLAMLLVGAWDRRIYTAEDLRERGVRCLGHLGLTKETQP